MAIGIPLVSANGAEIPAIGLGTFRLTGADAVTAVLAALAAGYRHIDTAAMYGNEAEVGEAIRASGLQRPAIFLTTKIWADDIAYGRLQKAAEASLKRLGVDQVDLMLIHWPNPAVPVAQSIKALCEVKRSGLARHIGVSNYTVPLLDEAARAATEPLAANQCEYHPFLDQSKVLAACRRHGMAFVSYCPLGRGMAFAPGSVPAQIAAKHGKTPAQALLRWHVQQGIVAIPKSGNAARIAENVAIGDFTLSAAEMAALSALKRADGRIVNPAFAPVWDA